MKKLVLMASLLTALAYGQSVQTAETCKRVLLPIGNEIASQLEFKASIGEFTQDLVKQMNSLLKSSKKVMLQLDPHTEEFSYEKIISAKINNSQVYLNHEDIVSFNPISGKSIEKCSSSFEHGSEKEVKYAALLFIKNIGATIVSCSQTFAHSSENLCD